MHSDTTRDVLVVGGGQAGAAAGYFLKQVGLSFLIVEKGSSVGTARHTRYDSLHLTHSASFAVLPGLPFGESSSFFPPRDEFIAYLERYYTHFDLPVQYNQHVTSIHKQDTGFAVTTTQGVTFRAKSIIAATGGCSSPRMPKLVGKNSFHGTITHSSEYQNPAPFSGTHTTVLGGGLSALQIAYELSAYANITLLTRHPIKRIPQYILGKEIVFRSHRLGRDHLPIMPHSNVPDDGRFQKALSTGRITNHVSSEYSLLETGIRFSKSHEIRCDHIIAATGFDTLYPYLADTAYVTENGEAKQKRGISTADPLVCFLGIPGQYSFSSGNIRGVGSDAKKIVRHLQKHLRIHT